MVLHNIDIIWSFYILQDLKTKGDNNKLIRYCPSYNRFEYKSKYLIIIYIKYVTSMKLPLNNKFVFQLLWSNLKS